MPRSLLIICSLLLVLLLTACGDETATKLTNTNNNTGADVGDASFGDIESDAEVTDDATADVNEGLLETGEPCEEDEECLSDVCEAFGEESICTETCDTTCPGAGLSCFDERCVPNDFCEADDGLGRGPGCTGSPCDRCSDNATCSNSEGDFECFCDDGFDGDGLSCADVDECATGEHDCDENAVCINTQGSYTCECEDGFEGDGQSCADIDECATGQHDCHENAACNNTQGTFTCECDEGFEGDGVTCNDVDECALGLDDCHENAACNNTQGSFTCECDAGFAGDGVTCNDVDECALGLDDCHENATCNNTQGSFTCECDAGFAGDGVTCNDVDECALGLDDCHENATCNNTQGSFTCECDAGFAGNGRSCTDIDECSLNLDDCHGNATCTNTQGSYTCECNEGYGGDGVTCTDIDECAMNTHDCDPVACNNTEGSYTCVCPPGTVGDGSSCLIYSSCSELKTNHPETVDGDYLIETTTGPIEVFCDMTSDGSVGHTMLRIDDQNLGASQDAYRAACAAVGMEVIVPRSRAHGAAITAFNNGQRPNLVNVFPQYNGATGLSEWEGRCQDQACSFYVSDTNSSNCPNSFEPNGDNSVEHSLYRWNDEEGCGFGQWNDQHNSVVYQGHVICSTNDAPRRVRASCHDYYRRDEVYNAGIEGISGVYVIQNESGAYPVYCDMTSDGGGWTLVWKNTGDPQANPMMSNFDLWASDNNDPVIPHTQQSASALHRLAWNDFGSLPQQEWLKIGQLFEENTNNEVHSQTFRVAFNDSTWAELVTTAQNCREMSDDLEVYINGDNYIGKSRHILLWGGGSSNFGLANTGNQDDLCGQAAENLVNDATQIIRLQDAQGTLSTSGGLNSIRHLFSYQHSANNKSRSRCLYRCWLGDEPYYDSFTWGVRGPLVYDSCEEVREIDAMAPSGDYAIDSGGGPVPTTCSF